MEIDFLDWIVSLDLQHYVTQSFPDYTPSGSSHWYMKGSPERFSSEELVKIYNNTADNELNKRWLWAIKDKK